MSSETPEAPQDKTSESPLATTVLKSLHSKKITYALIFATLIVLAQVAGLIIYDNIRTSAVEEAVMLAVIEAEKAEVLAAIEANEAIMLAAIEANEAVMLAAVEAGEAAAAEAEAVAKAAIERRLARYSRDLATLNTFRMMTYHSAYVTDHLGSDMEFAFMEADMAFRRAVQDEMSRVNRSLFYQISLVNNVLNQDAVRRTLEQHDMAITVAEGKRTDSAVSGMLDVTQAVTGFFGPKGIAVSALISGGRGLYDTYIAHDNLDSITQATAPAASAVSLGSLNPVNIEPLDFFFAYYGSLEITRLLKNNDAELVITDIDIKIIDSKIATATLNYESRLSGSAIDTFDGIIFDMVNIDGIWYIDEADMESFIEAYLESIHGSISS